MNKKEISEIKKQFSPANCCITRICGCYVDADKNKKTELNRTFLGLSEEEMFKYFEIFKKSLSGSLGKNLMNMDFPLSEEGDGGAQQFLLGLRNSKLKDQGLIDTFFDQIIEHYDYAENYYIILIHAAYDVPGKGLDNLEMEDASDEVYEHLLCSICPVNLSKAGLSYNPATNIIEDRTRDWIVEMPETGFLFPVFNERSTDVHGILYYSKNAEKLHGTFVDEFLGCTTPLSAKGQKESFQMLIEDTFGEDCAYDTVVNIHEKLNEWMESQKDDPDPVALTKAEVRRLFEECGVKEEQLETFDEQFDAAAGESSKLMAANITNTKRMEIKTPAITLHVSPENVDLIETRILEGRKYLVVPMEDVEVNGVPVRMPQEEEE